VNCPFPASLTLHGGINFAQWLLQWDIEGASPKMTTRRAKTTGVAARRIATPIGRDGARIEGADPNPKSRVRALSSQSSSSLDPSTDSRPSRHMASAYVQRLNRLNEFYTRLKQSLQDQQQLRSMRRQQQDKEELTECTFQPQLVARPPMCASSSSRFGPDALYRKEKKLLEAKKDKVLVMQQKLLDKEMAECSFRPKIRPRVLQEENPLTAPSMQHHVDNGSPPHVMQAWEESLARSPSSAQRAWEEAFVSALARYSSPRWVLAEEPNPQNHRPVFSPSTGELRQANLYTPRSHRA